MRFLFTTDGEDSILLTFDTWDEAEQKALEEGWDLLGEFKYYVDDNGDKIYEH